jgi:DNA-binding response OmpR family regulator
MKTRPGSPDRGVTLWREMEESVRVLVVEDEPKMSGLLRRGLAEESYAVDVVADGPDGFGAAAIRGYDALVLDVMLPNLSGFELAGGCGKERCGCRC